MLVMIQEELIRSWSRYEYRFSTFLKKPKVKPSSTYKSELTVMGVIGDIKQYVEQNPWSTETQLFSFLALMNRYIPKSYLLKSECQTVLGLPDPFNGGSLFERRMRPFTAVINTSTDPDHVSIKPQFARKALEVLTDDLQIPRTAIVNDLMFQLCGDPAQKHTVQFVKDLLTKRKKGENDEPEKFSRLIEDILRREGLSNAISVLNGASKIMRRHFNFPQTLARLHYIILEDYAGAEHWAKVAIDRDTDNSFVADTLAQVHKNNLIWVLKNQWRINNWSEIIPNISQEAFKACKDVERKAEVEVKVKEERNEVSFNNRGHFVFMQIAKIIYEDVGAICPPPRHQEVEEKFHFFEWYLTYSSPSKMFLEPHYFWEDVALCYQYYTEKRAADSTSFPGLLDFLNHGHFTSRGRRAGFQEEKKTDFDIMVDCYHLKMIFEEKGDVESAQRYILSNIILSNKTQNSSPKVAPVKELQEILLKFLGTGDLTPELNLLVLMLFWPEDPERVAEVEREEEVKWPTHELPKHVAFMEQAFKSSDYAKYLHGRYLLPLFFLGKGSGLNKWIHKSTLDAIVEKKVDTEQENSPNRDSKKKWKRILHYWSSGKVWQIPEIQEILLPVEIEPLEGQGEEKRVVRVGGLKIPATAEFESDDSALRFYLGLTIKGPVVFKVDSPDVLGQ